MLIRYLLTLIGLARKEDYPYITYYCPHCNALNKPKNADGRVSGLSSPNLMNALAAVAEADVEPSAAAGSVEEVSLSSSPVAAPTATEKISES